VPKTPQSFIIVIAGLLVCGVLDIAAVAFALDTFRALPSDEQRPAPAFTLPDSQGTPLALRALHDKVVVIRFWATW
jgi:cytochrome oxidase Cu insertion factor (SCO1/SenC/PrrC family)